MVGIGVGGGGDSHARHASSSRFQIAFLPFFSLGTSGTPSTIFSCVIAPAIYSRKYLRSSQFLYSGDGASIVINVPRKETCICKRVKALLYYLELLRLN